MLRRLKYMDQWVAQGERLELIRNGVTETMTGFEVEKVPFGPPNQRQNYYRQQRHQTEPKEEDMIDNLVLTVKAESVVAALTTVAHRLRPTSSILFLQNGLGFMEEVNDMVFPDADKRPRYLVGVATHGVYQQDSFQIKHTGVGNISLSLLPTDDLEKVPERPNEWPASSRYLLRTITRTPALGALGVDPMELRMQQLEKLASNCVINPLSVIYGCTNGELLHNGYISRTMNMLVAEISLVIRSLPELQDIPYLQSRFKPNRLFSKVVSLCEATATNESSMLVDVKNGRVHEANYLNGYILRRADELGINCVVNHAVQAMVKGKSMMIYERLRGYLPLQREIDPAKERVIQDDDYESD